ncbi:hypothetical protein [Paractinoplanes maris]|uniref:hypothetical protein n=1 Tax=Paractinoplanes maris TaxID=1734446 RepID=UPI00201FD993|nr:hypothetical protein [Actinoplanes maris]
MSIEILGEARGLAKKVRKDVEDSLKGLDMGKKIKDSIGNKKIEVPVTPDVDTEAITAKVKTAKAPKVPVEVDPLLSQFQQQLRRQVASLSRQVNANVPVTADTAKFRAELAAQLQAVAQSSRVKIPTEPGAKGEYEAKLRADLAAVAARVKQTVKVDVEVDKKGLTGSGSGIGGLFRGLSNITKSVPGLGAVSSALGSIGQLAQQAAGTATQLGGSLAGSATQATGTVGALVGSLIAVAGAAGLVGTALVGAFTIAIPAVSALAGAIASLPGLLTGIGAGIGTLALGFKGIAEAFKPSGGGGGGGGGAAGQAANQARQVAAASRGIESARRGIAAANRAYEASLRSVAAAERGLVAAQRAVKDATTGVADALRREAEAQESVVKALDRAKRSQEAVNQARRQAKENIEDLGRSLRGAVLSEREAAVALDEALLALDVARQSGDLREIQKAQLAYERAQLAIEETADATGDLAEEADDANKKGVENSDLVQDALRDQAEAWNAVEDAQQGVIDANRAVADAQQGVIDAQNGVIDATDALKSAQDGVASAMDGQKAAAEGLKSAQDSLAAAQQKVAAGGGAVAKEVTKLAPAAQRFVDAIKALKPAFEDLRLDVQQRLFAGLDKTVTNVGREWIPRLKVTLGSYADTFNSFFKNLGTAITAPRFMDDMQAGAESFRKLLERVGGAITSDLVPAFGTLSRAAGPFIEKLGDGLARIVEKFSQWVEDGRRSGALADFFDRASQALEDIGSVGYEVFRIIGNIFEIITGSSPKSGANPLQQFRDGLKSVADYLDNPANQEKIRGFIAKVQESITKAFVLAKQVKSIYDDVKSALGGGGDTSTLGQDIGAGIITGVLAGLKFQGSLIGDVLLGYFKGQLESVKNFLGINSPSTVYAEVGQNLIAGLVVGIGAGFGKLRAKAGEIRGVVVKATNGVSQWLVSAGRSAVVGLMNGLSQSYNALRSRASQAKTYIVTALNGAGNLLVTAGRNAIVGLGNGVAQMFNNLRARVSQARGYVVSALNGAGNLLVGAGRAIIQGLINGISQMIGTLGSYLNSIAGFVKDNKGPIEKDRVLLVDEGRAIMSGLISGIASRKDALASELADVTALVAGTSMPGLDAAMDVGRVASSLAVADSKQLQLGWRSGSTGDRILDAIAEHIDARYRGDVQAALSRT